MTDQEIIRAAGEEVMGWTLKTRRADGCTEANQWQYWKSPSGEVYGDWDPLTRLDHAGMLISAMRGRGWWCQLKSPFMPGEPWWAGFCPEATSGWNGRMDHRASDLTSPGKAVTLAALRALEVPNA